MKKVIVIFLIFTIIIVCNSCENGYIEENIVHPPVRVSENPLYARFGLSKDFNDLVSESEMIVKLKVKNWLGEVPIYERTCFEAEILDVYKGNDEITEIVLIQYGTSERTIKGVPLFDYGNEMVLFLKSVDVWIEDIREDIRVESGIQNANEIFPDFEYENAYVIVGGSMNIWNVARLSSGEEYIASAMSYTPLNQELIELAHAVNQVSTNEGVAAVSFLEESDPIRNSENKSGYVFKLSDLLGYVEDILE